MSRHQVPRPFRGSIALVYPCGSDIRKDLYANVVLPGGTATFQGIGKHRNPTSLQTETLPV